MKSKDHKQNQGILFPRYLEDWISEGHLCRFVNETIDKIDISGIGIEGEYKEGGHCPYDPRAMLKCRMYGYMTKVRTSSPLERIPVSKIPFHPLQTLQTLQTFFTQILESPPCRFFIKTEFPPVLISLGFFAMNSDIYF
ncbi:MAG TPA: hypothetical protein PKY81_07710 [bacterium]|nr:hypothetical protein [bacterium]